MNTIFKGLINIYTSQNMIIICIIILNIRLCILCMNIKIIIKNRIYLLFYLKKCVVIVS